jgi:cation diffusion facilitator family transporter
MHYVTQTIEYPKDIEKIFKKAMRLEWISFFYMISSAIFSFLAMSNSQTMKTVWLQDSLGIIPPASFLISSRIIKWKANKNFPYGYHSATAIAFLSSSLALLVLGIYLLIDSSLVLIKQEHTTISTFYIQNTEIWFGYIMMLALLWSSLPSTILGHLKISLSCKLYDKTLFADAKMNKASWMTGFASIVGIIGIGLGFWWADAMIAILISLDITYDGFNNLKQAIFDLLDEVPKIIGKDTTDPLLIKVKKTILQKDWVKSVHTRFRDDGHIYFAEIFIETEIGKELTSQIEHLQKEIKKMHWRFHDVAIMPYWSKPSSETNETK